MFNRAEDPKLLYRGRTKENYDLLAVLSWFVTPSNVCFFLCVFQLWKAEISVHLVDLIGRIEHWPE
jgi:hypothetical protein